MTQATRRKYLGGAGAALAGLLAAACGEVEIRYVQGPAGPAGPAGPQGEQGAAGASGAKGSAGAAGQTIVVEKEKPVVVEKIVEKEVVVERPVVVEKPVEKVVEKLTQQKLIRYLHVDVNQLYWKDAWNTIFRNFEEQNPQYRISWDPALGIGASAEKAIATFAAGDYYDFLYGHYTIIGGYVDKGVIQALDPFLAKEKDIKIDDFVPAAVEKFEGKTYGLAWFTNGKEFWYKWNKFQEVGVENPRDLEQAGEWTWPKLLEMSQKLVKRDGDEVTQFAFNLPFSSTGWMLNVLLAWGADWFDDNFTKATIDTPEFVEATEFAVDLVREHKVAGGNFARGENVSLVTGSYYTRTFQQLLQEEQFDLQMTLLPKGPTGLRRVPLANNASYVTAQAKDPDGAWEFNKFIIGEGAQTEMALLGGGRYSVFKDATPKVLHSYEDPEVYAASAKISAPTKLIVKQGDINKLWSEGWKEMVEGTKGVREHLTEMQRQADRLLKEFGSIS